MTTRLGYFALASLAIPGSLLALGGCHGPGYHNNPSCSNVPTTWAAVPKGDWLTNPSGAAPFIASMVDGGCSTPSTYKPCTTPNTAKCDFAWPMTTCPKASLSAIAGPIQSFDGTWDKCTGEPPSGSTGITWKPGPQSPGGGCHTPVCGE